MAQGSRKYLARLITEFVNRDPYNPQCLPQGFLEKYRIPRYRFGSYEVGWVAKVFRQAWEKGQEETFALNMEQVFADRLSEIQTDTSGLEEKKEITERGESRCLEGPLDGEMWKYRHPAFRVVPGKRGLVFFPRDPLDRMALELLRALTTNRLRRCKGSGCPTPLFVACHSKQKYCYRGCGSLALAEWKAEWHKKRKALKSARQKKSRLKRDK